MKSDAYCRRDFEVILRRHRRRACTRHRRLGRRLENFTYRQVVQQMADGKTELTVGVWVSMHFAMRIERTLFAYDASLVQHDW